MLKQRILTAVILAPLALAAIILLPLSLFNILVAGVTLLGLWEWTKLSGVKSRLKAAAVPVLLLAGCVANFEHISPMLGQFSASNAINIGGLIALVGAFWWVFATWMVIKFPQATAWWSKKSVLKQVFGILTLIPFCASMLLLRGYQYDTDPYLGSKLVLLVCLLVWAADTGAYFAGKNFGKHKMAPSVSPNKTIEGLIGGLIAAVSVMFIAVKGFAIPFASLPALAAIALITSFASVLGDLTESMFKRMAGIKDSGSLLPGHGGVLDRIDSLTAAFPVFTVLYFWLG